MSIRMSIQLLNFAAVYVLLRLATCVHRKISLWHEMSVLAIVYRSNAYKIRGKSAILMDFSISVDLSDK